MRKAFFDTLVELAEKDERVYLLVADIGFGLVDKFAQKFPNRFVNIGVAEQNMIGIATGLALSDKIVFVYSIANFPTFRCLEQIRNDVCYHNVPVCIVAGGTGLNYGALGSSHHATEDIAIMRALPNMTVIAPGDATETALATKAIHSHPNPYYLRLGYTQEAEIKDHWHKFDIGKAITMASGGDVCLITTGSMLWDTMKASKQLESIGINSLVLSMPTIKPLDVEAIEMSLKITDAIITIEEHSIIGGLGSAVAEVIAGKKVKFKRMGLADSFILKAGRRDELLKASALTVDDIVDSVKEMIGA
jgi:transketolase